MGAANMVDVIARGSTGEVSEGTSQHGRCWRRDVDGGVVEGGDGGGVADGERRVSCRW